MARIWKENLAYKDILQLKDAMDILAMHHADDAFLAVRSFLVEANTFVKENYNNEELERLIIIHKGLTEGKTVLVLVRGNWYQVYSVIPEQCEVVLMKSVIEAADNGFATHIYINEVCKVIVDQA